MQYYCIVHNLKSRSWKPSDHGIQYACNEFRNLLEKTPLMTTYEQKRELLG
jgi:hypothetical protein